MTVRFRWDEKKSKKLKKERGFGLDEIGVLFEKLYHLSQKQDDPEQWRAIGWVDGKLLSLIYEEREDEQGPFYWFVTYWPATKSERSLYGEG